MNIHSVRFTLSAPSIDYCPSDRKPEVCFVGRSNVGKSSLINAWTNYSKLARISNTPGKTRELNYYLINEHFYLVDMPGYGYAKVSKEAQMKWAVKMEEYLLKRDELTMVYQLIDSRHGPTPLDQDFMIWIADHALPFCQILTKADKLSKTKQQRAISDLKKIQTDMNFDVPIVLTSSATRKGMEELTSLIYDFL